MIKNYVTFKGSKKDVRKIMDTMREEPKKFNLRLLINSPDKKLPLSIDFRTNNRLEKAYNMLDVLKGEVSLTVMITTKEDVLSAWLYDASEKFKNITFENCVMEGDKETEPVTVITFKGGKGKFEKNYRNYYSFLISHERRRIEDIVKFVVRQDIVSNKKSKNKFLDTIFNDTAYKHFFKTDSELLDERRRLADLVDEEVSDE
ncbi:MAG: hypothetical protein ACRC92_25860 [Peptostreptococcaceae bacterium]